FRDVQRIDHPLLILNTLLLMCVAFVPFPTSLVAEYVRIGQHQSTAVAAYAITLTITSVVFNALWYYTAYVGRLLSAEVSAQRVRDRSRRYAIGLVVYGATVPLAFV